jgi:acyl-CoA reductase-like NAD-dependent aldehyde dehydrogenase
MSDAVTAFRSGEVCSACTRIFVEDAAYDHVLDGLVGAWLGDCVSCDPGVK